MRSTFVVGCASCVALVACSEPSRLPSAEATVTATAPTSTAATPLDRVDRTTSIDRSDPTQVARDQMVAHDIAARGVTDARVLAAMRAVPRHRFVLPEMEERAHDDRPLPIGHRQTISQPFIVAFMTESVRPRPTDRALDIGTGSGYHAAVLSRLVARVDSMDIVCPLADQAKARLADLGYDNVEVTCGNGWAGKPERAPFDVIIVAAAPEVVPQALLDQLAPGGRLIIPVGPQTFEGQELKLIEKATDGTLTERVILAVRFVPMTGRPTE